MVCDLCNNIEYRELLKISSKKDYNSPKKTREDYTIVECNNCGLVFVKENVDENEIKDIYSKGYYTGRDERGYKNYIKKHSNTFLNKISKLSRRFKGNPTKDIHLINRYVKHKGKLLEIGCAAGFFLQEAKKNGWDVTGVEISDFASNFAKDELNLNVYNGKIEEIINSRKLKKDQFDVVTLWDTLEHIAKPSSLLKSVNFLLKINGILFFSTLNIDSTEYINNGKNWKYFRPPKHLFYFSESTIKKYLEKYGFDIIYKNDFKNEIVVVGAKKISNL